MVVGMCLIAFAFQPDGPYPLRLIANRDERHSRPAAPLARWADVPGIVGGRDLQAGGSWLALHDAGRMAAVTNVRDLRTETLSGAPSRGELVREALLSDDLPGWLAHLAEGAAWRYAGFNLLVCDGQRMWHLHRGYQRLELHMLTPGLYGLSNASLDTPWPKLIAVKHGLAKSIADQRWPATALEAMADSREVEERQRLPDTGVGEALERNLSAAFILGSEYGTRAMTWLTWHADGRIEIGERRFAPGGRPTGETLLELASTVVN